MAARHDIEEDVPPLGLRVWAATSLNRYDADGSMGFCFGEIPGRSRG